MTERYADTGRFRRFVRWSAAKRPVSLFYARTLHHIDRLVYRRTRGRTTFAAWLSGITSPERERFMELANEVYPGFTTYVERAAPRRIAVFRLRRR